jgi:hypothetical protein
MGSKSGSTLRVCTVSLIIILLFYITFITFSGEEENDNIKRKYNLMRLRLEQETDKTRELETKNRDLIKKIGDLEDEKLSLYIMVEKCTQQSEEAYQNKIKGNLLEAYSITH